MTGSEAAGKDGLLSFSMWYTQLKIGCGTVSDEVTHVLKPGVKAGRSPLNGHFC